jgi:tetratricopeptide (TPR) repeat protein
LEVLAPHGTRTNAYQDVIDQYHTDLHHNPDIAGLVTNLAWAYERMGHYRQAIQHFHRALELDPNDFHARYGLGLALLGEKQQQDALEQFALARDLAVSKSTNRSELVTLSKQVDVLLRRLS